MPVADLFFFDLCKIVSQQNTHRQCLAVALRRPPIHLAYSIDDGLVQAKACGAFTVSHQRYWDAVRRARGDGAGTRALVEVLLAHRTMPAAVLIAAMDRAVDTGCLDPQVVLIDARTGQAAHIAPVIPIAALTRYDRPAPSLTGYDQLLIARSPT